VRHSRKPDLEQLVSALTADGRPTELVGRDAALAAFREARQRGSAGRSPARYRGVPFRRPLTGLPTRLAAAGAAMLIAAGMAAAYTRALPDPVQRLAHNVFAPLGVPGGQQSSGAVSKGDRATGITTSSSGGPGGTPWARAGYLITVRVSRVRVPPGGVAVVTGMVSDHGAGAATVRVRLLARLAGSARFELAAVGVTGPRGGFRLLSPPLTATTVLRVAGPDGAHSVPVVVTVAAS
jgi:hypothetical protein